MKERIKQILSKHSRMRDNDQLLTAYVWQFEMRDMGLDPQQVSAFEFLRLLSEQKFTQSETITRIRRRLQEESPELRGLNYIVRQSKQKEVRKDLGYEY